MRPARPRGWSVSERGNDSHEDAIEHQELPLAYDLRSRLGGGPESLLERLPPASAKMEAFSPDAGLPQRINPLYALLADAAARSGRSRCTRGLP